MYSDSATGHPKGQPTEHPMAHSTPPSAGNPASALATALGEIKAEDYPLVTEFECTLADNMPLAIRVLEEMAKAVPTLPTFEQFCQRLDEKFLPRKPQAPDKDSPDLYRDPPPSARKKDTLHGRVWRAQQLHRAVTQYKYDYAAHEETLVAFQHLRQTHRPDGRGYLAYCLDLLADDDTTSFFLRRQHRLPITEGDRRMHTYVTAGSGNGKSEALKLLVHHYLTRDTNPALVIIDPHGKFGREVAQLRTCQKNDRLVYINPDLSDDLTPIINPFDLDNREPKYLNKATNALIEAFAQILQGDGFSPQMEVLLRPCLATLLLREGSTLRDLKTFMDDDENDDLLNYAHHALLNPEQRQFLEKPFQSKKYEGSKHSILTRVQSLLNDQMLLEFTCGESSIDLRTAINQRKIVIIDTSCGDAGGTTCEALSRLVLSRVQAIATQRSEEEAERLPIHLFVDECQLVVSSAMEKILTQTRKFGLFATLAQQIVGSEMDPKLRRIAMGNTNIKITGNNGDEGSLNAISKSTTVPKEQLQALQKHHFNFYVHSRNLNVDVPIPSFLVGKVDDDSPHYVTAAEWERTLEVQKQRYYRPTLSHASRRPTAASENGGATLRPAFPIAK